VLGVLLAVGPVFIALLLFDSTRGLFEGWLRAALAFAFAPLAATLLLGIALVMLQPSLAQVEALITANNYTALGPVYGVLTLVLVFVGVSVGMIVAGGVIAGGLKLPRARPAPAASEGQAAASQTVVVAAEPTRAGRIAAAASAQDRRDAAILTGGGARGYLAAPAETAPGAGPAGERRTSVAVLDRGAPTGPAEVRLGQAPRRNVRPRAMRTTARSRR
jgi:type IV secretion system protein VirB6